MYFIRVFTIFFFLYKLFFFLTLIVIVTLTLTVAGGPLWALWMLCCS